MHRSGTPLATGCIFFFYMDATNTDNYTLSLHDALPIWTNQQIRFFNTAMFNNQSGASFTIQGDGLTMANFANGDRKSTRLHSSHQITSYVELCFKNKGRVVVSSGRLKLNGGGTAAGTFI